MKTFFAALVFIIGFAVNAEAQAPPQSIYGGSGRSLGYVQCTNLSVATTINTTNCSAGIPSGALFADIIVESQSIRYRSDGVAPTSSVGMLEPAGTDKFFTLANFNLMQFIQVSAGASLDIEFFTKN
jgi:hypothetical protein